MTRREHDGPPETVVDKLARRAWRGFSDFLRKILGRYYAPFSRNLIALVLLIGGLGGYGLLAGVEGSEQLLLVASLLLVATLWALYRIEQRWRDTDG
ncbi:hypothetical protein [Halovenus salina]|uniref:hypothetical protein n=1 Tax=Halovenus salina TaxID=1510225 RepID=UPI002260902F|nr:hypothetical protein [Halovenus salina]